MKSSPYYNLLHKRSASRHAITIYSTNNESMINIQKQMLFITIQMTRLANSPRIPGRAFHALSVCYKVARLHNQLMTLTQF
jgi:hypothetical protein